MFVHTPVTLPQGWDHAPATALATRALRAYADGTRVFGAHDPNPGLPTSWALRHALRCATSEGALDDGHVVRFRDGSALLHAGHEGSAFLLPWPVCKEGAPVDSTLAAYAHGAYTGPHLAAFSWREAACTPDPALMGRVRAEVERIAKDAAGLMVPHGVSVLTLECAISPSCVTAQGEVVGFCADISAQSADALTPEQDRALQRAFQAAADASHLCMRAHFPTPDAQLTLLNQGCIALDDGKNRRLFCRSMMPIASWLLKDHRSGMHSAMQGHKALKAHLDHPSH